MVYLLLFLAIHDNIFINIEYFIVLTEEYTFSKKIINIFFSNFKLKLKPEKL